MLGGQNLPSKCDVAKKGLWKIWHVVNLQKYAAGICQNNTLKTCVRMFSVGGESSVKFETHVLPPSQPAFCLCSCQFLCACRAHMKHPYNCSNHRCWLPQLRHPARSHWDQTGVRHHQSRFSLTPWNNQRHRPSLQLAGTEARSVLAEQSSASDCASAHMCVHSRSRKERWFWMCDSSGSCCHAVSHRESMNYLQNLQSTAASEQPASNCFEENSKSKGKAFEACMNTGARGSSTVWFQSKYLYRKHTTQISLQW